MLVSVGYMDPGNWATDLEGGARFGYELLWVLVVSNAMAWLLQMLSVRLGAVSGLDLASACRVYFSKTVATWLWILAELAIMACDLAEVLGSAVALNLLFGIPLVACGDGALRLMRMQRPGRAAMDADAFLRGFALPAGSVIC